MFNSFGYNQVTYNSIAFLLNNYIELLNIQIQTLIEINDNFINKFLRVHLKRTQPFNIVLKRNILRQESLQKPQFSLSLYRKTSKNIYLKRPRFKMSLERIGER